MAQSTAANGWIGRAIPRKEDRRLLTGAARFVADLHLPGLLEMCVVRSPHAHARILGVDRSALGDGVADFLTAADLPGPARAIPINWILPSMRCDSFPVLARDRVHYAGQAVAALLAPTRYAAEDAAEAVAVAYEPLPAVVDMDEALGAGAPLLYPEWGDNLGFGLRDRRGDVEAAFAGADVVVRQRVSYPRHAPLPIETRGVAAQYDAGSEQLTVWLATQAAHVERSVLAERLGFPEHRLRVIAPHVGGAFGSKLHVYPEEVLVALFALRTGRPVRWIEDRREHLLATIHAREQRIDLELAARRDGTLLGARARVRVDVGAHPHSRGPSAATVTMYQIPGPYRLGAYAVELEAVVTNKMPVGAYRGFGKPQATFAMERGLDALAARLGLDAAEVRRRNLVRPDELPYPNASGRGEFDSGDYPEALRRALELVGWEARRAEHAALRAQGVLRGLGVACTVESTTISSAAMARAGRRHGAYESAVVRVEPDGTVTLACSLVPSGQGHETALAQICADVLQVEPSQVRVLLGDTDRCPYSGYGTAASRGMTTGGSAALLAARQVRDKLLQVAAHQLEVAPSDVALAEGHVAVRGSPTRRLGLAEVALAAALAHRLPPGLAPGLEASATFDPAGSAYSYATHACEVEVDPETGGIRLLQYVAVDDCGTVVNPMLVDGQLVGAIAQSIGGALYEELRYDEHGQLLTASLLDYLIPTAREVPAVRTAHLHTPSPHTSGGFKGVGEAGTIPVPAAIANAVMDALRPEGAAANALPLTPERVLDLVQRSPFARRAAV
ncbi:MAG TPA: xanthine dehydrogenase family protein molybdopterin-binding subunit [Chloroflexota bacterium]|nr:xanthine dehydrogenase family protein molybdopterin-binding subunit [Chloroflexota bacterium]